MEKLSTIYIGANDNIFLLYTVRICIWVIELFTFIHKRYYAINNVVAFKLYYDGINIIYTISSILMCELERDHIKYTTLLFSYLNCGNCNLIKYITSKQTGASPSPF